MRRPRRIQPLVIALYVNAALLLAVLVAVVCRGGPSIMPAAYGAPLSPQPIAGGANLYLMPAQFTGQTWGCYVMDIDAQTLCAYRYHPSNDGGDLQLVAARRISYDRKLTEFNSAKPSPDEVRQWVEQANQAVRGSDDAAAAADKKDSHKGTQEPDTQNHR